MRRLAIPLALGLGLLLPLAGQTQTDDRGVVQAFLEDNLSDAGREVRITGFEGALSGRATIEELTIADDTGVWLSVQGAVFDWNRGALLRGRLEINELSAEAIDLPRAPETRSGMPDPEATPFVLPELPVAIRIGTLRVDDLSLGASLLGQAATFELDGAATLEAGAGEAELSVQRTGGPAGRLDFAGAFSNATRELSLSLDLTEAANGLLGNLVGLPGRPSVGLQLDGDGTTDDFTAELSLRTDGQDRLAGEFVLADDPDATAAPARLFRAELGGDLRPLLDEEYRRFLGPDLRFATSGRRFDDGRLMVEALNLRSDAMQLSGTAEIGANGWPRALDLTGEIEDPQGADVLLALPGDPTRLRRADIRLSYDLEDGDSWTLDAGIDGLQRPDIAIEELTLAGRGALSPDLRQVDGRVTLFSRAITLEDRALAEAVGPNLAGALNFDWTQGRPLELSDLDLAGESYGLTGDLQIDGVDGQVDVALQADVTLVARNLAQFAAITGIDLSGAADVDIAGALSPVSGAFDAAISGTARDLVLGIDRIDPLITGDTTLSLRANRDSAGLQVDDLTLQSIHARIAASGRVASTDSDIAFALRVEDLARSIPGADGPASIAGQATQTGTDWRLRAEATAPGATEAQVDATVAIVDNVAGEASGTATLRIGRLGPYADLTGLALGGGVDVGLEGRGDLRDGTFAATIDGSGQTLRTGIAEIDTLLPGTTSLDVSVRREDPEILVFDRLELKTSRAYADLTGSVGAAQSRIRFSVDLNDLGVLVQGLNGAASAQGTLRATGGPWTVSSAVQGPGGMTAQVDGQVAQDPVRANLSMTGTAPLALANRYISPRLAEGLARFDLRLDGAPGLNALSGTVRTDDARLTLPLLQNGLTGLAGEARINAGAANLDLTAGVRTGGRVALSGRAGLTPPYRSDLIATLSDIAVSQSGLFETTVDGRLDIGGALSGGALLRGDIALGTTEVRIPDGAGAADGALPGLVHLNEPPAVRQTRLRAGLIETGNGAGADYPIDLLVRAPARIFIRGRGLDAELGGSLRLLGSTSNVVTEGRFDLIRGRLDILGKRLTLSEAYAQLQGDLDPFIRAVAETESDGTLIQVIVEGLASAPEVTFTSTPELPEDEVLARLLFGRDLSEISALQALRIANAVRTLAGGGGEGVVGRLRQNFGLDDLDIETGEGGETGVRVGKYINDNLYTDVTVDSAGRSEINLNLSVTPSITARGSVSSDGNSGIGLYFERDY